MWLAKKDLISLLKCVSVLSRQSRPSYQNAAGTAGHYERSEQKDYPIITKCSVCSREIAQILIRDLMDHLSFCVMADLSEISILIINLYRSKAGWVGVLLEWVHSLGPAV